MAKFDINIFDRTFGNGFLMRRTTLRALRTSFVTSFVTPFHGCFVFLFQIVEKFRLGIQDDLHSCSFIGRHLKQCRCLIARHRSGLIYFLFWVDYLSFASFKTNFFFPVLLRLSLSRLPSTSSLVLSVVFSRKM